jgi:hypothetical protein
MPICIRGAFAVATMIRRSPTALNYCWRRSKSFGSLVAFVPIPSLPGCAFRRRLPLTREAASSRQTGRAGSMAVAMSQPAAAVCAAARLACTRGCRRYLGLYWFDLLWMLARQVLGTIDNDQEDRYHPIALDAATPGSLSLLLRTSGRQTRSRRCSRWHRA